ncbi:BrnT family toxin [Cyanobium sp. Maggiore-St4-Cus]|uniref:PQQ-dependent sugar dehydrogenase n=1 Tax=Cyanobium sp. Maggiore-St4-Cus TaxID=2823717 RepID=UPI0020CF5535|nr:PQQ-dependent sugar dehydrogenase [Cyanobium sp. Maggiore-St4-Cus]MCP9788206.1 BrnT family toxin [Cyanobium sp. Maggiore-St4-Cus]
MKPFRWSSGKNQQLGAQRSIHFEAVVVAIETGGLLDVLAHPNPEQNRGQRIIVVVEVNQYVYLVPYVEDDDYLFLKAIIPSRKATRDYLRQDTP